MMNEKKIRLLYIGMQFTYWAMYCVLYGFASIYLLNLGFQNKHIGIILAASNIFSIILQWIISTILINKIQISLNKVILTLTFFMLVLAIIQQYYGLSKLNVAILYFSILACVLTLQPFVNSLAFNYINNNVSINFGLSRGVGSLSFAITAYFLGLILFKLPVSFLNQFFILLIIIFLVPSLLLKGHRIKKNTLDEINISKNIFYEYPFLMPFLIGVSLLFCFHTIITTFITQIILNVNGTSKDVSIALMIAGLSELPIMFSFKLLIKRRSVVTLLKISSFFFLIRSAILLMASSVFIIQSSQILQSLSFALFIPASAFFLNQFISNENSVQSQTYLNLAMTIGGVLGSLIGGVFFDIFNVFSVLILCLLSSIVGFYLINIGLSKC